MVLSNGYMAPQYLYSYLYSSSSEKEEMMVCTCGEWYRFPSSYFLPKNIQLGYLPSSFHGQLPQPFTPYGSTQKSLEYQTGTFNHINAEELDRYVQDISQCHYIVEYIPPTTTTTSVPECIQYIQQDEVDWQMIQEYPFLDVASTSTLHRAYYIPFLRKPGINVHYGSYTLFQRRNKQ